MSSQQLPLGLRFAGGHGWSDFLAEEPSPVRALQHWLAASGGPRLLLHGAPGSGKTLLLHATAEVACQQGQSLALLPLRWLGGDAEAAVLAQPALDCLLVDELEAIDGAASLQRALFALLNRQQDAGGRLLLAGRINPAEWNGLLPDLRSRLGQAERWHLPLLGEAQRRQWLVRAAARRGIELDPAAVEFLFRRVGRDLAGLAALLERIDQASLAQQRRVTVPFLRSLLGDPS